MRCGAFHRVEGTLCLVRHGQAALSGSKTKAPGFAGGYLPGTPHQTVISYCLFITSAMRSLSGIALGKAAVRGEAAVCRPQPNGPVSRLIPGGPLAAAMGRRLRSRF